MCVKHESWILYFRSTLRCLSFISFNGSVTYETKHQKQVYLIYYWDQSVDYSITGWHTLDWGRLLSWHLSWLYSSGEFVVIHIFYQFILIHTNNQSIIIMGFFIPVSSLKVFGHSILSERRMIYLVDQYKLFRITPLSYHDYSVSGSCILLLCLFSSILVHHKNFFVKYLINIDLIWLSVTRYDPKLPNGLTCHLCSIGYIDVPNKGIEQACSWASCDIHTSPFSINLHFSL